MNCCKINTKKIGLSPLYELFTKGDRKKEADNNNRMAGEGRNEVRSGSIYWRKKDRSMLYMYFIYHINIFGKLL